MTHKLFYSTKQLRQAANAMHGFGYTIEAQHVGGRGDALMLAPENPSDRETANTYFIECTDAGCYVHKPAPNWGEYDAGAMQKMTMALYADVIASAREALPADAQDRLRRAIDIVLAGAVNAAGTGFEVGSQNGAGTYTVNGRCDCPDADYNAPTVAGRPACKHQIAAWIVQKVDLLQKHRRYERETAPPAPKPARRSLFKTEA